MPLYSARCPKCGVAQDYYAKVRDYEDTPECCGGKTERVICAPMVAGDIQPYRSMIDGRIINSRSEHRDHLRDHGCVEVGNEKITPKPMTPPPGLKETLIRVANEKLRG